MAKHRAGDRRIISISIPEKLAERLDRQVGKGRKAGRSASITKMIEEIISENLNIDILVNNAGVTDDSLFIRMNYEKWQNVIKMNLDSNFLTFYLCLF